jgi:hypothetical protein
MKCIKHGYDMDGRDGGICAWVQGRAPLIQPLTVETRKPGGRHRKILSLNNPSVAYIWVSQISQMLEGPPHKSKRFEIWAS